MLVTQYLVYSKPNVRNGPGLRSIRSLVGSGQWAFPLGLFTCADYDRTAVKLQAGDLVLLYSDGVTESTNPAGDELGPDGLMSLVKQLDCGSAEGLGVQLPSALRRFRGGAEAADDETIIVLERVSTDSDQPLCKRTRRRVL
jgi:Stage II sporulation protein E (SpoIIE)